MRFERVLRTIGLAALFLATGCATAPRDIQTPTGPVSGQVRGSFIVLGVVDRATSTLSRPGGSGRFVENVSVDVPAGTTLIVPALRGWDLGFGSTMPEDLSPQGTAFSWRAADRYLGMESVNVAVIQIFPRAPGATTQRATVEVSARLTDINGDDPWWGVIRYELVCLGRAP